MSHACLGRASLTNEQRAAVRRLTTEGDGIVVVIGVAGAGKTFRLRTCADARRASGTPVCGAAAARRAARELETGAGIPSTSISAMLFQLNDQPLQTGSVLVIDEAGMAGTRALAALAEAVDTANGKLVLVGDDRQLQAIDAGGAFRALARRGPSIQLTQNRRQVYEWEGVRRPPCATAIRGQRSSPTRDTTASLTPTATRRHVSGSYPTGSRGARPKMS
jgi:ATP-dependent exoDNAse (exonuclease V) alpha subunit